MGLFYCEYSNITNISETNMHGKRSLVFSVEKLKTVIKKNLLLPVKYIFLYYTVGEEEEKSSSSSSSKVLWFNMRQVSIDLFRPEVGIDTVKSVECPAPI